MKFTILIGLFLVVSTGCDEKVSPEQAQKFVDGWAPTVTAELEQRAGGAAMGEKVKALLTAAAELESEKDPKALPAGKLVSEVYAKHDYAPVFVKNGKLTKVGTGVWKTLQDVPHHALDPQHYKVADIAEHIKAVEKVAAGEPEPLITNDAEKKTVLDWVQTQSAKTFVLDETSYAAATTEMLDQSGDRLNGMIQDREATAQQLGDSAAELEFLLGMASARLIGDLRYAKVRRMFLHKRADDEHYEMGTQSKRPDDMKGGLAAKYVHRAAYFMATGLVDSEKLKHDGVRKYLGAAFAEGADENLVDDWFPPHPQYKGLVGAHKTYQKFVDAGGWKEVEKEKGLKVGSSSATVAALKKRLKAEGYLKADADESNTFDKTLETAITNYQKTHQMDVKGVPHKTFWSSINVDAKRRLKQISINIKRLRLSNVRNDEDEIYVFVNIPDFTAEVWKEEERKMRFNVVVGNNNKVKNDETGDWDRANRTPVHLAAYIDRVIYNPYWNITPRVRTNELVRDVNASLTAKYNALKEKAVAEGKDPATVEMPYLNKETGQVDASKSIPGKVPGWYASKGYEVLGAGTGWERVRQKPGRGNALGRVKVIFPNLYDVYLHDTNQKALFKNPVRAYSHGCMRMEKPIEFAEFLLRHDGQYESANVEEVLEKSKPKPIFLKKMIPVFVEYYTVRVDDEKKVNFLADIYGYDDKPVDAVLANIKM